MHVIQTEGLTYHYSNQEVVLKGIDLKVEQGSIYGFLGPNGAGKTTTLRLILGLLKIQEGSISIFGLPFHQNRIEILTKVGSLIETPSLYGHLTAFENLNLLRKVYRCPKERIEFVLKLVGLANTGNKKAIEFSLGMKQRLSIAISLLHNPSLIVLDEPTNGLDPNGIIEVRELLISLNKQYGITILISSHLLSEIEKLVTHVGIIHQGSMRFQGTLSEMNALEKEHNAVIFETSNTEHSASLIDTLGHNAKIASGKIIVNGISKSDIPSINQRLMDQGIQIYEISPKRNDLEAIFMDIINNGQS